MKEARVQGAVILEEPTAVRRDNEGQPSVRPRQGTTLRVGLIGAGKMGMHHLKAIKALPNATVVGIADPAASREALEGLLPAEAEIVPTAAELLNRIKPDVVHIVTPPGSHASLAK